MVNPEEVVALGAAKLAQQLSGNGDGEVVISDVTPLTLGTDIAVVEDLNFFVSLWKDPEVQLRMDPVIKRNTTIPHSVTKHYETTEPS